MYVTPPSLDVSVCVPVSKFEPPSRVSFKSLRSKPVTTSVNVIVIEPTAELRGSGVTAVIVAVGTVRSVVHESLAFVVSALLAVSTIPEPLALSDST